MIVLQTGKRCSRFFEYFLVLCITCSRFFHSFYEFREELIFSPCHFFLLVSGRWDCFPWPIHQTGNMFIGVPHVIILAHLLSHPLSEPAYKFLSKLATAGKTSPHPQRSWGIQIKNEWWRRRNYNLWWDTLVGR